MLLALVACFDPALAATLSPPPGEAVAPWVAAAQLAGLDVGQPGQPDGVTLEISGEYIVIRAVDAAGRERTLVRPYPRSQAEREEVAGLGASLLRRIGPPVGALVASLEAPAPATSPPSDGVEARADAPIEAPRAQPAQAESRARVGRWSGARRRGTPPRPPDPSSPEDTGQPDPKGVAAEGPAAPAPIRHVTQAIVVHSQPGQDRAGPTPEGAAGADDDTAEVAAAGEGGTEREGLPELRPWGRLGPGVGWRSSTGPSAAIALDAGVAASRTITVGVHAAWDAPREVVDVGDAARVDGVVLGGGAWWSPDRPIAPLAGVRAEAAFLRFLDGDERVDALWTPRASLELGVRAHISGVLSFVAAAQGGYDLRPTTVQAGDADPVPFSAWEIGGTAGLLAQIR